MNKASARLKVILAVTIFLFASLAIVSAANLKDEPLILNAEPISRNNIRNVESLEFTPTRAIIYFKQNQMILIQLIS